MLDDELVPDVEELPVVELEASVEEESAVTVDEVSSTIVVVELTLVPEVLEEDVSIAVDADEEASSAVPDVLEDDVSIDVDAAEVVVLSTLVVLEPGSATVDTLDSPGASVIVDAPPPQAQQAVSASTPLTLGKSDSAPHSSSQPTPAPPLLVQYLYCLNVPQSSSYAFSHPTWSWQSPSA